MSELAKAFHEHKWVFQHIVYWDGRDPLPGSGAYPRYYGDKYFCEKCLETKILNERRLGNSYEQPHPNTFPK